MTTKNEYLNSAISIIDARNTDLMKQKELLKADDFENEKELANAHKSINNRVKENNAIKSTLHSNDIAALLFQHRVDMQALMNDANKNTRECKKRLRQTLQAIAARNAEKLAKADYHLYTALITNRVKSKDLELDKIKSTMKHETTTQARYFADFAEFMNFAKRSKANDKQCLTFDIESAFFKKIASLFA